MNGRSNALSVDDIQTMSMTDIVELYRNGYSLSMSTWLGEDFCIGTEPNQTCIKNQYLVVIGGIAFLLLLTR